MSSQSKHAGGRPALPPAVKRKNWNITLSDGERAAIEAAAARAGQPPRVWARQTLLGIAALRVGRSSIGIDLDADYARVIRERLSAAEEHSGE